MICQNPMQREEIAKGTAFGSIADSRFKTNLLTLNLLLPLQRETVTENALIPLVLEKCWEEAPTNRAFSRELNRLYGASVSASVSKLGNAETLTLSFSAIDSSYALAGENLLLEGARILLGLLLKPVLKDGMLESENLELQKQYLFDSIQAEINEKRSYALGQTVKKMFGGAPCALNRMGYLEDIPAITPEKATKAWRRIVDTARIEILHVGMGDPTEAKELFRKAFSEMERHPVTLPELPELSPFAEVAEVVEEKPVAQAKLCLGFTTGVNAYSPELSAMRLMTAIYGGTATSRLFANVREKQSLCYYCAARFDRTRGILLVDSGVDREKAEQAKAAILRELEAMCNGEFTDEEMEFARLSLENSYRSVGDSAWGLDGFYLTQTVLGRNETPEMQAEALRQVTREQVCEAASRVKLAVSYLLAGGKEESVCEEQ